jgi:hypothetical protein
MPMVCHTAVHALSFVLLFHAPRPQNVQTLIVFLLMRDCKVFLYYIYNAKTVPTMRFMKATDLLAIANYSVSIQRYMARKRQDLPGNAGIRCKQKQLYCSYEN